MSQIVRCPLCRQDFKVALPSKAAKGGCPKCKGELMLLPDGTLKPFLTKQAFADAPTQLEKDILPQIAKRQEARQVVNSQPQAVIPKQVQAQTRVETVSRTSPAKPIVNKKVAVPLKPPPPAPKIVKPSIAPSIKSSLPPTRRFAEVETVSKVEVKEEAPKEVSAATERHFVKLASILLLLPFVIGSGLYTTRKIPAIDAVLKRSGEIASDGFIKLFATPPPEPVKKLETPKPQPAEAAKKSATLVQSQADNKEYEKRRLGNLISEKLEKFRLKQRTIKKYSEGALKDEQKKQVEDMEKDLDKDKAEIEDMKKEYQDKFGEPFKEGDDN